MFEIFCILVVAITLIVFVEKLFVKKKSNYSYERYNWIVELKRHDHFGVSSKHLSNRAKMLDMYYKRGKYHE
jgi:hypothetical protein